MSNITLVVIDEGPILNKLCYGALDRTMKDLVPGEHKQNKIGGKSILVSGDFRQLLPVTENANRGKIVNHTLKHSSLLWDDDVITLRLREHMRVKNEMNKLPNDSDFHRKLEKI